MDLGFARRSHMRSTAADPAFDYRMLLASVSARQAVSPTARAQAMIGRNEICAVPVPFVTGTRKGACKSASASFHADVASEIAAECKSL
jgi:hypothetical protein